MNPSVESKNSIEEILSGLTGQETVRTEAREALKRLGLPSSKNEEYKFAPITRVLEKNFDLSQQSSAPSSLDDLTSFSIDGLDAHVVVLVNGFYSKELSSLDQQQVTIDILTGTQWVDQLGTLADYTSDALVAWNTAAWTETIHIQVADQVELKKPVIIHHIHDTLKHQVKSFNRILISIGRNSSATVIEKQDSTSIEHPGFSNVVIEGFVQENATLNLYTIQADHGRRFHFGQTTLWQNRNSRVNCFTLTMDGKFIRNNLQLILDGEGCESHMLGLYLVKGDTLVDNHTVVDHKKANSFSNELYKGVIDDNAKGVFNGKIFVRPHAQKTNAFQSNRNILLSDKATVNTKPQLEIWADDVKCSHGCTTGQLDEEALFYLRARGINYDTARAMMLYAFAGEVVEAVKDENLKTYLDSMISERLHKNF